MRGSEASDARATGSALREREQMLTSVVEGNPIATFVIDAGHRVLCWNRACAALTGWSRERMLGSTEHWRAFYAARRPVLADLVLDQADAATIARHYGARRIEVSQVAEGAFEAEHFFPDVGAGGRWIFFTAAPLRDASGAVFGAVETLQDVTERNRAREEIERYRENLEAQVVARTAELASANEELSQYAYAVSHDLKAPLRAVRNYADFLREDLAGRLDAEQAGYLDGIQRALEQGEQLIEDLLDYSHVGESAAVAERLDLGAFLRGLLDGLALEGDVVVEMAERWPLVCADRLLLRQVFQNLVTNAVKFNRSVPRRVRLDWQWCAPRRIEVAVRDNGIGIADRHREQIFRIFQRLHTRSEYPGVGIGLAIVRKALAHLDGAVRVESVPGVGSTFFVALPAEGAPADD